MVLHCLGLSHKTAPVEIREKIAFSGKELGIAASEVAQLACIDEAVVLSTCNRMEIYTARNSSNAVDPSRELVAWLGAKFALSPEALPQESLYSKSGETAAAHLFSVASGLESMVLGETEIFGQVKDAYAAAQQRGATGRLLNKLFQEAFRVGKLVRNTTEIQRGSTSVGAVAVELAEKLFGDLAHCQVMLLGAGEISRRTAQSLQSRGANSIIVSNRNHDRAVEMAREMNGRAQHFDAWPKEAEKVDIIISSTAAPHVVITVEQMRQVMRRRRGGRPLFLIDIAVPRDIEPGVNDIEDVYLFDIDALEQIAAEGREKRQRELEKCRAIVTSHAAKLLASLERTSPPSHP